MSGHVTLYTPEGLSEQRPHEIPVGDRDLGNDVTDEGVGGGSSRQANVSEQVSRSLTEEPSGSRTVKVVNRFRCNPPSEVRISSTRRFGERTGRLARGVEGLPV